MYIPSRRGGCLGVCMDVAAQCCEYKQQSGVRASPCRQISMRASVTCFPLTHVGMHLAGI